MDRNNQKVQTALFGFLLTFFFIPDRFAEPAEFQPTPGSRRQAIANGQVKEYLAAMEARALETEKSNKLEEAVNSYMEASSAARASGQVQKMMSYAGKAVEVAERAQDPRLKVEALLRLTTSLRDVGQPEKAIEWLQKGIELAKQIPGDKEIIQNRLYRQLGISFLQQGMVEKAIEYLSIALQYQEARVSFFRTRARNARRAQAEEEQVITTLYNLGTAYQKAVKADEAVKAYEKGISIIKQSGLKTSTEINFYWGLGQAHLLKKDYARALETFKKALEMAEKLNHASTLQIANRGIGDVFLQTQKPSEAVPYFQKAIGQIESARSLLQSQEYRQSFFEGGLGAYLGVMEALWSSGRYEEAFNYSERARSRIFLDLLGSKVQLSRLKGVLSDEERALNERIAALRARSASREEVGEETEKDETSIGEIQEAEKAYNAFLANVRKESKEQASLMSVDPVTLKEAQALLDPEQTVIEYFVTPEKILLWVVDREHTNALTISIFQKELVSKVDSLRHAIAELKPLDDYQKLSQELYRLLIQPALSHIKGKELIIVPHAVLHYLPFQALYSPKGKYLIEEYTLSYLSSASLLQFVKEKRRARGERVLAFGNPDLGDLSMNLRFAEREAREIQRIYPQSTVLVRQEATEEKSKSLSSQYDIVHFATHAELAEDDPLSTAILLATEGKEDGRLEVREIFQMDLKAGLVVLSACETGLGKLSTGDELVGMTRAFIYAGTPTVVASLWKVQDASTTELMASLYKNLRSMSKVEALRQAQLGLIRSNTSGTNSDSAGSVSTSHPYFWAPFILVGDGK